MGLDMYLLKTEKGAPVYWGKGEIGYWRQFNALHAWFVRTVQNGVDDCGNYPVTKANLEETLAIVREICMDRYKAERLLPTKSGFWFGSTAYDERYFFHLLDTIEILNRILNETDFETEDVYYHSSW